MGPQKTKRRLAAILSADVQGYSRLMGEDEALTVQTLTAYRESMSGIIGQHGGRVVDSPGDNLLVEFPSVVDAVTCAVEIQDQLREKNTILPDSRKMEFRIGINLGDVISEGERIYGDGVNIAARVEGLADAGGICISGTVHDHIENKLTYPCEYLGTRSVKNIRKPIRVYRVLMESERPVKKGRGTTSLPDKPSIAVLPFTNMSRDPEQEYFSDGITEDLITDLSKISDLFVIARNSVFTYKGKAVRVQDAASELGVRYVLEGSVRKAGNRVRITSQLVDGLTGGHVWAERYDRELEDIFAVQDEVTRQIVAVLAIKIGEKEKQALSEKHTQDVDTYDVFLRGLGYFNQFTKEASRQARRLFEKAIAMDPGFALAHAKLGWTFIMDWIMGWSWDPGSLERALQCARKALSLRDDVPEAHCLLGEIYLWLKEHDKAIAIYQHLIDQNSNHADAYADLGNILNFAGRPEEALKLIEKGMRLNPLYPIYNLFHLGHAYLLMNRGEEAVSALEKALHANPDFLPARAFLAAAFIGCGREQDAKKEAAEILKRSPETSLDIWQARLPYKNPGQLEVAIRTLREAGLR